MNDNKNIIGLVFTLLLVTGLPTASQTVQAQSLESRIKNSTSVVEVKDEDINAGETVNWTKDNTYLLDGYVFAEEGATLNIEPGTVIKAKRTPTTGDWTSALIISRGAKIYAQGTKDEPIIFTSEQDDVNLPDYDPADGVDFSIDGGLWGGVVLLGKGDINVADELLFKAFPDESRSYYGGTDDADNSGAIQYTSIRYAGAQATSGARLPGLTLAATGSGTTLDHIEIFNAYWDGFLLLGGAPNTSHLAASFSGDDSFEYDKGFRGSHQFWFALQHSNWGDDQVEAEGGDKDNLTATPLSQPVIFNATFIGSGANSNNNYADVRIPVNLATHSGLEVTTSFIGHFTPI